MEPRFLCVCVVFGPYMMRHDMLCGRAHSETVIEACTHSTKITSGSQRHRYTTSACRAENRAGVAVGMAGPPPRVTH